DKVTVKPPDVFSIISGCKAPKEDSIMDLACLVTGYVPEPVKVTWHSEAQGQIQKTFPSVRIGELYTLTSLLSFPASEWKDKHHRCIINHYETNKNINETFQLPASWNAQASPVPTVPPRAEKGSTETTKINTATTTGGTGSKAPSSLSISLLSMSVPAETASWLLCEVSGFSPPDILLMWLEDKREVNPSWFASTHPMAQAGNKTFRSWSILRLPATAGTSPATYTCVVRHEASRTMLNASKILDTHEGPSQSSPWPALQD
uniref:Ig-like domain-containing protein n=1 Tax=Castor canadensis TaxID=51338 RepID=A0A8C0WR65_CASCN